jgi:hypothetical protein
MPEHFRALVFILAMAAVVFAFSRKPATALAIDPRDFARRRNLWILMTVIAFVSGDFWIFMAVSAIVLLMAGQGEQNRTALFLGLLYAVPAYAMAIPGFGIVQQFFTISWPRLLAIALLLPAFLTIVMRPDRVRFGSMWADRFIVGILVVNFGVALYVTTFTNVLRATVFQAFLDVFLPYYVASRSLRTLQDFRDTLMTFVVAAMILAVTALFESYRSWLLYTALTSALGNPTWGFGDYLGRGGAVRATASAGHPIALGFVLAVAIAVACYTRSLVASPLMRRLGLAILVGGMVVSFSRGPWVGAAAGVLVFLATGRGAGKQVALYTLLAGMAIPVLQMIPGAKVIVDMLPFIGASEAGSVDYRQSLIDAAFEVIWDSPIFGGVDIYSAENLQDILVPGQGGVFVDVVNNYIGVMLATGFVGLSLFVGAFAIALLSVWQAVRRATGEQTEQRLLGRALLAALACVLVTIGTASSITIIATTYWTFLGIAVAYGRLNAGAAISPKPAGLRHPGLEYSRGSRVRPEFER